MELPSIDQNICGAWTEQQNNFYNSLPFYFMEGQTQHRKYWPVFEKLCGRVNWKPNMGPLMRTVVAEPTPVLRQFATPVTLDTTPLADVINYRERKLDSRPHWQDFVSPHFNWYPEFVDFMKHVDNTMANINTQIEVFENTYYRTQFLAKAPYVYVAGVGLVDAPTGEINSTMDAAGSKTTAWLQNAVMAPLAGVASGYLTFQEIFKVLNAFEQEVGGTPYEGTGMPKADSSPLNQKFCLVMSGEAWNQLVDDPWLKENRPLNMNIVTDVFKGDLWGRVICKLERLPLRASLDANFSPTFPVPETIELNPDSEYYGRTKPNPAYSKPINAQVEMAMFVGGPNYDIIEPAPPPAAFTSSMPIPDALKMNWNSRAYMTKNFLVPCKNADGTVVYDANSFGRYLRLQATTWVGARATNPFNILPIFFKRRVGVQVVG